MRYYKLQKLFSRVTSSQRGEKFNFLIYPFLLTTLAYGIGFTFFAHTSGVGGSSLFAAMTSLWPIFPLIWGITSILTIVVGITFLLFNIPPAGKASGIVGFMVWVFATFCWGLTGGWLLVFALGIPNMSFWIWQYLSLSLFRREDAEDKETMEAYDRGEYDDDNGGRELRISNRGVDRQ